MSISPKCDPVTVAENIYLFDQMKSEQKTHIIVPFYVTDKSADLIAK